jgi:hypothetical protein
MGAGSWRRTTTNDERRQQGHQRQRRSRKSLESRICDRLAGLTRGGFVTRDSFKVGTRYCKSGRIKDSMNHET